MYEQQREESLAVLLQAAKNYNYWSNRVEELTVASNNNELAQQCEMLEVLDQMTDKLDTILKSFNKLKAFLGQSLLPQGFETVGVPSQFVGDQEFKLAERITGSFKDKELGYKWLRDIGEGSLITETVNANTLSAFLKRHFEEEATTPPEFVKINILPYVKLLPIRKKNTRPSSRAKKAA